MNELDKKIYDLSYDKNQILSFNGNSVESFIPNEGKETPEKYIVINRERKSISDSNIDISIIDSINNRVYPGALILANKNLVENKPDYLSCERNSLTISVDLPGMGDEGKMLIKSHTYSEISSGINKLLELWNTKYSNKYTIPARVQYNEIMVYSESQVSAKLGLDFKSLNKLLDIDFKSIFEGKKKAMIISYKQIFYNVSIDTPNNPSEFFKDTVSWEELEAKGVNNDNPPAYISNVSYGRTVFVKLETTSTSSNVEAAFKALIMENNINNNTEYKEIFENSSFTAVVLGGGVKEHNKIISKDFEEIRNIIRNNSEYSPKNPGLPISYTSVFLKDNSIAKINLNSEYIETKTTEYNNGSISLRHDGAYVARFDISWDELNYNENGEEVLTRKNWAGNGKDKTASFSETIYFKGNTRNIGINIKEATGLVWEPWRTLVNINDVSLVKNRSIKIYGTTLNPYISVNPRF